MNKTENALKLALEYLRDNQHYIADNERHAYVMEYNAFVERLEALAEQPAQQETVAWRNAALRVGEDLCSVGPFGYYDMSAEQWLDWALSVVTVHAPPASKPWVGLTVDEFYDLDDVGRKMILEYGRAVEAKLREKNAQLSKPLTEEQWQEIAAITGCVRIEKRGRDAILRVLQEAAHGIKGDA